MKTKKIEIGVDLDFYPEKLEFEKNEIVYVEKSNRTLTETKVVDILYEEYELNIKKGKKIDGYWLKYFKDKDIEKDQLYAIKQWKPFYLLENGQKIEWPHQLYHKDIED